MRHYRKPLSQSTPSRSSPIARNRAPASHFRPREIPVDINNSNLSTIPNTPGPSKRTPAHLRHPASKKSRSSRTPQRRKDKATKEIIAYQKNYNLLIQKMPFARLVREIAQGIHRLDYRFTVDSLLALQEASEYFLISYLEAAYVLAHHSKRVTLMKQDLLTLLKVLNIFAPGSLPFSTSN